MLCVRAHHSPGFLRSSARFVWWRCVFSHFQWIILVDCPPLLLLLFFWCTLWEQWRGLTSVQHNRVQQPASITTLSAQAAYSWFEPDREWNVKSACRSELGVVDSVKLTYLQTTFKTSGALAGRTVGWNFMTSYYKLPRGPVSWNSFIPFSSY